MSSNFPHGLQSYGVPVVPSQMPAFGAAWFVDNVDGANGNSGKNTKKPVATIARAVALASAGDTIFVNGTGTDYDESVIVTQAGLSIIAQSAAPWMAGWTADTDATILTIKGLGCRVAGFYLRPDGATSGIAIDCSEITYNDVDGTVIDNNLFKSTGTDALAHIMANGCPAYVQIRNNHFTWGATAITNTSAATTTATGWEITDNMFSDKMVNGIYLTARRCMILRNSFSTHTVALDTVGYAATNGDYNQVHDNYFGGGYQQPMYQGQTNDDWSGNFTMDTGETEVGDNGITIAVPAA